MKPVRVLIVEDHHIFRLGLRRACENDARIELIGEASNGEQAVKLAGELQPDIVLMDINMPIMNGIEAASFISEKNPQIGIVMLTVIRDDQHVFEAIKAGARGYLLKDIDEKMLVQSILAVASGDALINPEIAARVLDEFRRISRPPTEEEKLEQLTDAEMEILKHIAQGESNEEIARELHLSEKTVINRLSTIYQKLHVNNRTQAALYAIRKGWAAVRLNL